MSNKSKLESLRLFGLRHVIGGNSHMRRSRSFICGNGIGFVRCDPLQQTKRSRLQKNRCTLNEQISKQLRLRTGAENLLKATEDSRLRQQINVELSFVTSNIDVLRSQLSELNTAVDAYQSEGSESFLPVIPVGLKQTTPVSFATPLKDFILEHYSIDGTLFDREIAHVAQMRARAQCPSRDSEGVKLLHQYISNLSMIDKRFFGGTCNVCIYFQWFDSLTGEPNVQRSVAFEKGSTIFNLAALHSQIAASCQRHNASGLCAGIEHLKAAAGLFMYLRDNFSHAPSPDMHCESLNAFIRLLMAQAYECQLDLLRLSNTENMMDMNSACAMAKQAVFVSHQFGECRREMQSRPLTSVIPMAWSSLCAVKRDHHLALAYHWTACAIMPMSNSEWQKRSESFCNSHFASWNENFDDEGMQKDYVVWSLLKQAVLLHEDALTCVRLCKDLRAQRSILTCLTTWHESSSELLNNVVTQHYDIEPPTIKALPEEGLIPIKPRLRNYKVNDIFHKLGPVEVFCARRQWTFPRQVILRKTSVQANFGMSIRGDSPVSISHVESCGLGEAGGLCPGDVVVSVNGDDTKWACHDTVIRMLTRSGATVTLEVVSPARPSPMTPAKSMCSLSSTSSSSTTASPRILNPSDCTLRPSRKNGHWSLKNLLTLNKLSRSTPNIYSEDLYCL